MSGRSDLRSSTARNVGHTKHYAVRMISGLTSAAFMISDVTRAILSQSEIELKRVIASGDVSSGDFSLCEMCFSWAPGLRILLESMSVVDPYELEWLLRSAVEHGYPDTVKLLIDYGSPIFNPTVWACDSKEIKNIVLDAFIARRKHLLELARTMLPEYSQEGLRLERGLLPDSNAGKIHTQLKQHNILVPSSLQPRRYELERDESVFHGPTLSVDDMDLLYTSGFRDIDALDSKGYTPISRASLECFDKQSMGEYIERLKWFVGKGASLHSPPTITGSVPCHHISRNLTYYFLRLLECTSNTTLESLSGMWRRIFGPHLRGCIELLYGSVDTDNCSCSCSVAGCTPISMTLRIILEGPWKYGPSLRISQKEKGDILQQLLLEIPSVATAGRDVLRFITFTDLRLTHTCCRFDERGDRIIDFLFEEEEAAEIQDEERLLLIDFEGLLEDIMREYDQLNIPLLEYIRTSWCHRVREYLWKNGEEADFGSLCNRLDPDFARQWDENTTHELPQ